MGFEKSRFAVYLNEDPQQIHPLSDERKKEQLLETMGLLMRENNAPEEIFLRFGLENEKERKNSNKGGNTDD